MNKVIIVANAGWCFIGDVAEHTLHEVRLVNASVIRVWGTTKGIGQIALCGPTKDTILDPCGEVTVPVNSVVSIIKCIK